MSMKYRLRVKDPVAPHLQAFRDNTGTGDDGFVLRVTLQTVPLPAALPLFGAGLALMGFVVWRRKQAAAA